MCTSIMIKRFITSIIVGAILYASPAIVEASPIKVNCRGTESSIAVAVDCSQIKNKDISNSTQAELIVKVDTRIPRITYNPQVAQITYTSGRSLTQQLSEQIEKWIDWAAEKVGLKTIWLRAVALIESGGNHNTISPAGALGVMQLMPETAKALGVNPYNVKENILGAAIYLRQQLDQFGSLPLALAAYNAGPEAVRKYRGIPPFRETVTYVARVMRMIGGEN